MGWVGGWGGRGGVELWTYNSSRVPATWHCCMLCHTCYCVKDLFPRIIRGLLFRASWHFEPLYHVIVLLVLILILCIQLQHATHFLASICTNRFAIELMCFFNCNCCENVDRTSKQQRHKGHSWTCSSGSNSKETLALEAWPTFLSWFFIGMRECAINLIPSYKREDTEGRWERICSLLGALLFFLFFFLV